MIAAATAIVVGVALMAAPAAFGYAGSPASDVHRTAGPVIAAVGTIAAWPILRGARFAVVLPAVILAASPVLAAHTWAALVVGEAAAAVLVAVVFCTSAGGTMPTGGGWWALVRDEERVPPQP